MAPSSRLSISLLLALACERGEDRLPEDRRPGAPAIEARTFAPDATLMFVYADETGRFATATARAGVPEMSRRVVRVIEPTAGDAPRGDYDVVWVADLREAPPPGGLPAEVVSRVEFEARALAALPPGQTSPVQLPGAPPADAKPLEPHDQVILYGTSWCGACRQARTYLTERGVTFVDKDVERDPAAAAELQGKARRAGISTGSVPIIDVRGRLMVGFDPARLAALLGDRI
jgi:glutaredoxin